MRRPAGRLPPSRLAINKPVGGGGDDGIRASDESIVLYFCPEQRISKDRVLTLAALPGLVESKQRKDVNMRRKKNKSRRQFKSFFI